MMDFKKKKKTRQGKMMDAIVMGNVELDIS